MEVAVGIAVIIIAVFVSVFFARLRRTRQAAKGGNVIDLKSRSRRSGGTGRGQVCSRCKQRRKLTFYADASGAVRGLCKACRRELERHQELYPV
ncbi:MULTISPECIES: hypothetical protein [Paenibacillus]|uniref:Uncharacterized protein n=1 Tax=Paenibacillus lactis TaxID=228574 RepID=A0ABS4FEM4_9BACL|nr:hypothetical protein [Paenibacillus lactis]MBP1894705.1 hypothetical protein [Paenibacillus lactis]HAG00172.1 hypothetical protein [Paenibacillus lactis]